MSDLTTKHAGSGGLMLEIRPPTDAEVEAMAEKLWDVWRATSGGAVWWNSYEYTDLSQEWQPDGDVEGARAMRDSFRAMARVALASGSGGEG